MSLPRRSSNSSNNVSYITNFSYKLKSNPCHLSLNRVVIIHRLNVRRFELELTKFLVPFLKSTEISDTKGTQLEYILDFQIYFFTYYFKLSLF